MKTKNIILSALMLALPIAAMAQTNEQKNESQRQYYYNYSRFTIGINGGISALFGDFSTFSSEKFYPAPIGSLSIGYQMNPTLGFTVEGYYSYNRIGATSGNKDYYLDFGGFRATGPTDPNTGENFSKYADLYSDVTLWQGRLGLDINLNNLFGGNRGERTRKTTFIFSPSYYLQYYRPTVYRKSNDARYTSRDLFYQVNSSVGAELAIRFHCSRALDFQVKGGAVYGFNRKFDGIADDSHNNILAYLQAGVVLKLNGKTKRDNLIYAATPAYVPQIDFIDHNHKPEVVHDTVYIDRVVEKEVIKEVGQTKKGSANTYNGEGAPPAIGFVRGQALLDKKKYARQLNAIITFLKNNPDMDIDIEGWADHTGGYARNAELTRQRAETLRNYLVSQGISARRIKSVIGKGKDMSLAGKDALSVKARRADIKTR